MHIERPGLIIADQWKDYQLLDCGDGLKQEKWGPYTLVRPDPQIIWPRMGGEPGRTHRADSFTKWEGWDGFYHRSETGGGKWEYKQPPAPRSLDSPLRRTDLQDPSHQF